MVQLSHPYMTTGKTIALTIWIFVGKMMSLPFDMLSRFVIAFLPRSKYVFISWLQSPSTVILEPREIKSVTTFTFSLSICYEVMERDAILIFWTLSFKSAFSVSFFTLIISSSSLSTEWYHLHIWGWGCWYLKKILSVSSWWRALGPHVWMPLVTTVEI